MRSLLFAVILCVGSGISIAAEFKPAFRTGEPIADRKKGWNGHIEYASWVDDSTIVYATVFGKVTCLSVTDGKVKWSFDSAPELLAKAENSDTPLAISAGHSAWSLSRKTKRLAHLFNGHLRVFDCTNGKALTDLDEQRLPTLVPREGYLAINGMALTSEGQLILCMNSTEFGKNGYILDSSYGKVVGTFDTDRNLSHLTVSADDSSVAGDVFSDKIASVRDFKQNRDLFLRGKRVLQTSKFATFSNDPPFASNLRHDGKNSVVYSVDNSWRAGTVYIHDIKANTDVEFSSRNDNVVLDVNFASQRILLSGTSEDLTLVDFAGRVLAETKKATLQQKMCVEFSPSGKAALVGSWDNSVRVFEIVE